MPQKCTAEMRLNINTMFSHNNAETNWCSLQQVTIIQDKISKRYKVHKRTHV